MKSISVVDSKIQGRLLRNFRSEMKSLVRAMDFHGITDVPCIRERFCFFAYLSVRSAMLLLVLVKRWPRITVNDLFC